jgi:hypothetical protein
MKPLATLFAIALLVAACSTTRVSLQPATDLRKSYSRVDLNLGGSASDPSVGPIMEGDLRARLTDAGFLLEENAPDAIRLEVEVYHFNPGNVFWRKTFGLFGAGRGSLAYTARYVDPSGMSLAEMSAKEIFTGLEVHYEIEYGAGTMTDGAGGVRKVLSLEAAKHIVMLACAELQPKPRRGRPPK